MNLAYSMSTRQEFDFSPHIKRIKHFHYQLKVDDDGKIVGGEYYRDSHRMDMLWIPVHPAQGGEEGNKRGNPYVDVKEVLALWRSSVSQDQRSKWFNIDPTDEDRIAPTNEGGVSFRIGRELGTVESTTVVQSLSSTSEAMGR